MSLVHTVKKLDRNTRRYERYPTHVMWGMLAALILANVLFRWWPSDWGGDDDFVYDARSPETIQVEDIQQTTQRARRPPPPRPLVPVLVPNDEEFEEVELDLDDNLLPVDDPGADMELEEGAAETTGAAARADRGPQPRRIVEPQYPREANRRNVRAEVVVRVLVNRSGRVEQTEIVERYLLSKDDGAREESVATIGYGIEEAALDAARQWMFSPAREEGKIVQSWTTVALRFGI